MKGFGLLVSALSLLILPLAYVVIGSPGATVTMNWNNSTSKLLITLNAPVNVGAAQIVLNIPAELGVGAAATSGFMTNAAYLSSGTEHRWFKLQASGGTAGTVEIPITVPTGGPYLVSLITVSLKDGNGQTIALDTSLPITIQLGGPFDFSLSSSGGMMVAQGSSGSNMITVGLVSGTSQSVSLSKSVPSAIAHAVSVSFNPSSGYPPFTSTCQVTVYSSAPTGLYTITVIGTGGGVTRTTSFTLAITTTESKGNVRIVLDASPRTGYVNKPVTISGIMYGSWRCIWNGVVVGKPVTITTGWGFSTIVTTDYYGRFSVTTNCPSTGGTYPVTATFIEDQDLKGNSTSMSYEVTAKIPTSISVNWIGNRYFLGVLKRTDTGAELANKAVRLTVTYLSGGTYVTGTWDLTTDANGAWKSIDPFPWYWTQATISFAGDETYAPSSATITR